MYAENLSNIFDYCIYLRHHPCHPESNRLDYCIYLYIEAANI